MGQAYIDVDRSNGPGRGNVYVLASVLRLSNSDPGDVMFARSTDGGQTWDDPIRINDDLSSSDYQWFGTMSVAPNGRIDAVWLDTRDAPGNSLNSSLYYAYSLDQGETWTANIRLSDEFDPHVGWPNQNKMGDYFHMVSDDAGAHLAWCGTFNGEQDVYYGRITPDVVGIEEFRQETRLSVSNHPNPFTETTTIRYVLNHSSEVDLAIYDAYGKRVQTLVKETRDAGAYKISFDAGNLAKGVYHCRLSTGRQTVTSKMILIR